MKFVTGEQMRALDRRTIEEHGIAGENLMECAGRGVAEAVLLVATESDRRGPALCFAGKGNNGGDAFVAARCLGEAGFPAVVILAGEPDTLGGDAATHFERMRAAGIAVIPLPDYLVTLEQGLYPSPAALVVDGILGTGTAGAARGAAREAIDCINRLGLQRPVIAIDIPSGLNADTGEAPGACVRADLTVTMGLPKCGMAAPTAFGFTGSVETIDISIPPAYVQAIPDGIELIAATGLARCFPRRPRQSHKGTYGHALLIGGSAGFAGAIALAARGALRSGTGLVSVLTPESVAAQVAAAAPEAMVHPGSETDGALEAGSLESSGLTLDAFDAVLVGPGLSRRAGAAALVERVTDAAACPLVVDADALPDVSQLAALAAAAAPVILTPHPGEMARLLGVATAEVQADRPAALRQAVERTAGTVVLKGAGTLVGDAGTTAINLTGNPGMAAGGAGDVLAGLMAGLAACGLCPADAARAAVYLHGMAGDLAAWRGTQASLTALDIVDALPRAFRRVTGR